MNRNHCPKCGKFESLNSVCTKEPAFKKGVKLSEEHRQKLIESWKTRAPVSEETKLKISRALKGRKLPESTRIKMSNAQPKGELSPLWRGGQTTEILALRASSTYRIWRTAVFTRDDYTCVLCGVKGGKLNADHIKPFAIYKEERFNIENGRTLCEPCHRNTDTFGRKSNQLGRIFQP